MSDITSLAALKNQIALALMDTEQLATLDRRTRREVDRQVMQMARVVKLHMMAQDAATMVHMHTLHKVGNTLASAEYIKAMRSPYISGSDLEQLDAALRASYLESANYIANQAIRNILARLE